MKLMLNILKITLTMKSKLQETIHLKILTLISMSQTKVMLVIKKRVMNMTLILMKMKLIYEIRIYFILDLYYYNLQ